MYSPVGKRDINTRILHSGSRAQGKQGSEKWFRRILTVTCLCGLVVPYRKRRRPSGGVEDHLRLSRPAQATTLSSGSESHIAPVNERQPRRNCRLEANHCQTCCSLRRTTGFCCCPIAGFLPTLACSCHVAIPELSRKTDALQPGSFNQRRRSPANPLAHC